MPSQTNESALEAAIEKALTGACLEDIQVLRPGSGQVVDNALQEARAIYRAGKGYWLGDAADFKAEYAIDERRFWHFLENTQPEELDKLRDQPQWQLRILQRLDRMIRKYGILRLLRQGLEVDDAHFNLLYALPLASSSKEVHERFAANAFCKIRSL